MAEQPETVVLARFNHRYEADIAHGYLQDAGIESVVSADDGGGTDLGLGFTRRVRLIVLVEDQPRAHQVLDDAGVL